MVRRRINESHDWRQLPVIIVLGAIIGLCFGLGAKFIASEIPVMIEKPKIGSH